MAPKATKAEAVARRASSPPALKGRTRSASPAAKTTATSSPRASQRVTSTTKTSLLPPATEGRGYSASPVPTKSPGRSSASPVPTKSPGRRSASPVPTKSPGRSSSSSAAKNATASAAGREDPVVSGLLANSLDTLILGRGEGANQSRAHKIAEALRNNTSLKRIVVSDWDTSSEIYKHIWVIAEAMENHPHVTSCTIESKKHLRGRYNEPANYLIAEGFAEALAPTIKRNLEAQSFVLNMKCTQRSEDGVRVSCTSMDGENVLDLDANGTDTVAVIWDAVHHARSDLADKHIVLVLEDERVLDERCNDVLDGTAEVVLAQLFHACECSGSETGNRQLEAKANAFVGYE